MTRLRVVVDTNVIVSGVLRPDSVPGRAYHRALDTAELVFTSSLIREVEQVLGRTKFDRYVEPRMREAYLRQLIESSTVVPTVTLVTACRDPKDNHVLEAAVNGAAELIITGDADLLSLNPFHNIRILAPALYLSLAAPSGVK